MSYAAKAPWPQLSDGFGASLELMCLDASKANLSTSWIASIVPGTSFPKSIYLPLVGFYIPLSESGCMVLSHRTLLAEVSDPSCEVLEKYLKRYFQAVHLYFIDSSDAHVEFGGSPGAGGRWLGCLDGFPSSPRLVFTEVMYHPYKQVPFLSFDFSGFIILI